MVTVKRALKVLGFDVDNENLSFVIEDGLTLSLTKDGRELEKLWPGCTVYWDQHPNWVYFYLRVAVERVRPGRARPDDKLQLIAFQTNERGQLVVVKTHATRTGVPIQAVYTPKQWVVIR